MTTTVQLARGSQTIAWTFGDPENITLYEGDVSAYRCVRIAAEAYTENGGLELKALEVTDPATPIVLLESETESSRQRTGTTLDVPGLRLALVVWVDEAPTGKVEVTFAVWGRDG